MAAPVLLACPADDPPVDEAGTTETETETGDGDGDSGDGDGDSGDGDGDSGDGDGDGDGDSGDGDGDGSNAPPSAPVVEIQPAAPVSGDALVCAVSEESVDPDGDPVSYSYAWTVDGNDAGLATDTVPMGDASVNESWTCTVTPSDGIDDGPSGEASVDVGPKCISLSLDGSDRVEASHYSGETWTVEGWFKIPQQGGQHALVSQIVDGNSFLDWEIGVFNMTPYVVMGAGDSWSTLNWGEPLSPNEWHHIAGMYDGTQLSLAVDGVLSMTTLDAVYAQDDQPLRIGSRLASLPFLGEVFEVRVSNTPRYDADFEPERGFTNDAETARLWRLDEGAGALALDEVEDVDDPITDTATWVEFCPGDGNENTLPPLAGYWPFNGDTTESSGANIDLTPVGDPEYLDSVAAGLGTALSLDGNDAAVGANFVKFSGDDATLVAWVYADDLAGTWNTIAKNWGTSAAGQFHLGLGSGGADTPQSVVANNDWATSVDPLPLGEWVHTAVVFDSLAGEHRLYINGALTVTANFAPPLDPGTATGFGIGAKPNNDGSGVAMQAEVGFWIGSIDEVGMFNAALTSEQVAAIYQDAMGGVQLDGTTE